MKETVRDYRPGTDDAALSELWKPVFGSPRGGQTLEWLFRTGPAGDSPRVVAEVNGRIVAHAGATALRFRLGGEEVRGGYSVGAMTDPEMRGRGLFSAVGKHLYERMEREGFAFVGGFSNRNSYRLMTGPLGRIPIRPFPWCVRILRPVASARALLQRRRNTGECTAGPPARSEGDLTVMTCAPGDHRIDSVWRRSAEAIRVGAVRDAAFVASRFAGRPEARYRVALVERTGEPVGYAVVRCIVMRGIRAQFVVDFLLAPEERRAGGALLAAVEVSARAQGAHILSALLPGHGHGRDALKRAGYFRVPEALHPQLIRFSVRGLGHYAGNAELANPASWFLSWADTDVV